MRIKINGIENEKTLFSLKKVTDTFYYDSEFVGVEEDLSITFSIVKTGTTIKVITTSKSVSVEEERTVEEPMDERYAILGAYYRLLCKITKKTLPYGVLNGIRPTKLVHRYLQSGMSLSDINKELQSKYFVSKEKADLLCEVASNQLNKVPDLYRIKDDISIYINIPFCPSRCSYCSFTAFTMNNKHINIDTYLSTLFKEMHELSQFLITHHINITTIYIGGGTPTSLNESQLEKLLKEITNVFNMKNVREFTVEAGRPDSITKEKLMLLKQYKVDRISINPQTFDDETLELIGRHHKTDDIVDTFSLARHLGHQNINMDLIIGLPNEKTNQVKNSIHETLNLNPESITVHTLALKKSSYLKKKYSLETLENLELIGKMHKIVNDVLNTSLYKPYYLYRQKNILGNLENIGYAKQGFESLYNIIIMEEVQNIIGLGCGSSSKYLIGKTILSPKDLKTYVQSWENYFEKKINTLNESINYYRGTLDE